MRPRGGRHPRFPDNKKERRRGKKVWGFLRAEINIDNVTTRKREKKRKKEIFEKQFFYIDLEEDGKTERGKGGNDLLRKLARLSEDKELGRKKYGWIISNCYRGEN